MTESPNVLHENRGSASIVSMARPERRNALSVVMREELISVLTSAMDDRETRVVILTGSGGHFCAGGDLDDFDLADVEAGRLRMRRAHVLPRLIATGRKPVVAAIEGSAFGAGLSIALMCDHVIAAENARLCASFVNAGLMPDYGSLWSLYARGPHALINEMVMQARQLSGADAAAAGLINAACPAGEVLDHAMAVAEDLARRPPLVLQAIKEARAAATGLEDLFQQEIEWQARLFVSEDFAEAVVAFKERRKPEFKGR